VRPGYREIRVKFRVRGEADEATIRELPGKSPVYDTLANPAKMRSAALRSSAVALRCPG
jgi:hypothetical protein